MKKILKIIMIVSILISIACPIMYNIIGSKVLEDGTLDEPFYLVGFMFISFFIFIVSLFLLLIIRKKDLNN